MKKIVRNMSTAESRSFWETAERAASEVQEWPMWKRAGINVAQVREEPTVPSDASQAERQHAPTKK